MKEFVCIICPRGCHLKVDDDLNVTGNSCPRGKKYGYDECTHPMRNITSTVKVISKHINRVPCKTSGDIPKERMFDVMDEINKVCVNAPVSMHQVLIKDVLGLGVDVVATREIKE